MTENINTFKNIKYIQIAYVLGIIFVIAGSLGHFFEIATFKYVFAFGTLLVIISQLLFSTKSKDADFRKRRQLRLNVMLGLMLALATYSMFDGTTLWIAVVLIYALVTLIMSFRG
jgi:hypothetical protein